MNTKQKNFIRRKLIPFILREHGKGFGMTQWGASFSLDPGEIVTADGIERETPPCGYVACIGGSIDILVPPPNQNWGNDARIAEILGLTTTQVSILFYGWERQWPQPFQKLYAQRKTPRGKAKVAVELLKEVVRTNGEILET